MTYRATERLPITTIRAPISCFRAVEHEVTCGNARCQAVMLCGRDHVMRKGARYLMRCPHCRTDTLLPEGSEFEAAVRE